MTKPLTREQQIQNEALLVLDARADADPMFYVAKQFMRRNLNKPKPPALIEFLPNSVVVIDHDLQEYRF